MTAKRFQWVYIKDNSLELRDNGTVKVFNNERLEELLNELHDENKQLKEQRHEDINDLSVIAMKYKAIEKENERLKLELQRIYDVATLKKARDIVDMIYDDLLYETSEKSDYARNKVLECLKKLDEFGDELE